MLRAVTGELQWRKYGKAVKDKPKLIQFEAIETIQEMEDENLKTPKIVRLIGKDEKFISNVPTKRLDYPSSLVWRNRRFKKFIEDYWIVIYKEI